MVNWDKNPILIDYIKHSQIPGLISTMQELQRHPGYKIMMDVLERVSEEKLHIASSNLIRQSSLQSDIDKHNLHSSQGVVLGSVCDFADAIIGLAKRKLIAQQQE